jgi:hypothetical protein
MRCMCGIEIDELAAEDDQWVCPCGRVWEIINGELLFSGSQKGWDDEEDDRSDDE